MKDVRGIRMVLKHTIHEEVWVGAEEQDMYSAAEVVGVFQDMKDNHRHYSEYPLEVVQAFTEVESIDIVEVDGD